MTEAVAKVEETGVARFDNLTVKEVVNQVTLIKKLMNEVMKEGEHYGRIPGCGTKPSLLKPGAEKIGFMFRLVPYYEILEKELPGNHKEFRVTCTLKHIKTNEIWGTGVSYGSTMESKWRYRTGPVEPTGEPVPKEYWDNRKSDITKAQDAIGGKGFAVKKVDGTWQIVKKGEMVENTNPADIYNTCIKVSKKRSHVDATLTATAASDFFTQDIEEMVEDDTVIDVTPETVVSPASPPPDAAKEPGTADAPAPAPKPTHIDPGVVDDNEDQAALRDHLEAICNQILDEEHRQDGGVRRELSAILYELTVKDGKYGKTDVDKIFYASRDRKFSPLKLVIKKAEARLESLYKASDEELPDDM